jgi:alpha,alpha-trehalose phosphorylase
MKPRDPELPPEHDWPIDPWRLIERRSSQRLLPRTETLFAVANGFLGMRGNPEEGRPVRDHGTLVNGFHETWPIEHAEQAYGLARTGQTIVDVPDAKIIKLYIDDEPLYLPSAPLSSYERVLDFRAGTLDRSLVWDTPSGKLVQVRSRRLTSLRHRHLAAFTYEVTVLNADAPVVISSQLHNRQDATPPDERGEQFDPRTTETFTRRVLNPELAREGDQRIVMGYRTSRSRMTLAAGMEHEVTTRNAYQVSREVTDDVGKVIYTVQAKAGEPFRLDKFASYHTSDTVPSHELADRADRVLARGTEVGFDRIVEDQAEDCDAFWERADVQVGGDERVQQAVRWNLFQLLQAAQRVENTSIPAKGLTGHGYQGHYFWDIDIYVMPFLCYTQPRIAKNILRWRRSLLDHARERASELDHHGALYPWRTINGEEASAYYQAGTAQYHLNADIAYALERYVEATGDRSILGESGAEVLAETARLWCNLGFHASDGTFRLHGVTGPDEYTTLVNDNTYTNLMARHHLRFAARVMREIAEEDPNRAAVLREDIGLAEAEIVEWERAADAMFVPYDSWWGVHPQDAHFLERNVWDIKATPKEKFPLLLHYHPLVIYRHQVLKQADMIMALCLLGDDFDTEQKRRNFEYYEPLTTGDSSLSPPVQAIVAAEIGQHAAAMHHFRQSLFMDLADVAGNADHGVHVACAGGTWQILVNGFAGMRNNHVLTFDPRLPSEFDHLAFKLTVRAQMLHVTLTHGEISFSLSGVQPLDVAVRSKRVTVQPYGERTTVPLT